MRLGELLPKPESCGCEGLKQQMNSWGIAGCERNLSIIKQQLASSARTAGISASIIASCRLLGAGYVLNPLDPFGSLVKYAIEDVRRGISALAPAEPAEPVMLNNVVCAVTSVGSRVADGTLARTYTSLKRAGISVSRVYIDGVSASDLALAVNTFGPNVTARLGQPAGAYSSWMSTAWELLTRNPEADRYVIFQDDIVASLGLAEFLANTVIPDHGYCNLCTYPENAKIAHESGWSLSNQLGLGAQGLMFNRDTFAKLLSTSHLVLRVIREDAASKRRRAKYIDGAIVTALKERSIKEYVHNPSPICHVGEKSTIGNHVQPPTALWRGEDFDLRTL